MKTPSILTLASLLTFASLALTMISSPERALADSASGYEALYGFSYPLQPVYVHLHECIEDRWIRLDLSPQVELRECQEGTQLEKSIQLKSYPRLKDNPYEVNYWKGSYTRKKVESWTYLHEVTDRCTRKTLLSERKILKESSTLEFPIQNPNLSDDVYASYQLVPMTDEEARAALTDALHACERITTDLQ